MSLPVSARPSLWPTVLTIARLIAAPVVAGLILWADSLFFTVERDRAALIQAAAAGLFVLAAVTDALDGWLARKLNAITPLGAALDHAADKALVTATLGALIFTALPLHLVVAALILLVRDVAVAGLREGLALSGRALPVSSLGKAKAWAEMFGAGAFLFQTAAIALNGPFELIRAASALAAIALWAAAAAALASAALYVRAAARPAG